MTAGTSAWAYDIKGRLRCPLADGRMWPLRVGMRPHAMALRGQLQTFWAAFQSGHLEIEKESRRLSLHVAARCAPDQRR